jgi:16S rRNA (guanine1207-N2)-methyltransferase
MSGAAAPDADADLIGDPGVLAPGEVLEINGFTAVAKQGGLALLPWRGWYLRATALGLTVVGDAGAVPAAAFPQAVVRVQKGRAATQADLAAAWRALRPGGRLLVSGPNRLGIATWAKRVAVELGQTPTVLANRAHGRVVAFRRDDGPGPADPAPAPVPLDEAERAAGAASLVTLPGVFSGDGLDAGTAALIGCLGTTTPARRILDLGCGAGHLALNALRLWPEATALLLDSDHRAVRCAGLNLGRCGLAARAEVGWWDAAEPLPGSGNPGATCSRNCSRNFPNLLLTKGGHGPPSTPAGFDLVLLNPPCHAGWAVDLAVARALFRAGAAALAPGGRLLVVANRALPYEAELQALGAMRMVRQAGGFKVIEVVIAGTLG